MTIKILHTGDIHIHLYKPKVPIEWQLNRFKLFFQKMLELEKNHDLTVLAGDIFDKKPEPDEMTLFNAYLNKVTKPTIIIPGNHEASKKGETFLQGYVRDEAISNPNVWFFTKNARIKFMGYWVQMFPYTEMQVDNLENHLEKDILITHIRGEVPPNITAEYDFEKLRSFPLVLCSDLHFYHKYKDYNVYYPGSPLNVSFDRNDTKKYGILSHTYAKDFHTHEFIDLNLPRLLRKKVSAGTELVEDPINRVIYEVEGKLEDIQKVKNSDLLDKKIVELHSTDSVLDLKNKSLLEEIATYLKHILQTDNIKDYLDDLNAINISSFESVSAKIAVDISLDMLQWSNMYSFGDNNTIDFNKNKVTQLDAVNGSGKTAIMLILQEILTSKNMKSIKKGDIVNRYRPGKSWSAKLDFKINSVPCNLSVSRDKDASKVKLIENGIDISEHKIPDTYKTLLKLLNATPEVLNQLIYQSSTSQLEFLKATDTNRKKFLVGLFSLERYLQIGEVFKLKITTLEKELAGLQGELKSVHDFLSTHTNLGEKQTKKSVPEVEDSLKREIENLEHELKNINTLSTQIDKNNLLKKERLDLVFDIDLQDVSQSELLEAKTLHSKQMVNSNTLLREIERQQKELSSLNTATHCYACKQPIENKHALDMAANFETSIKGSQEQLKEVQNQIVETKREVEKLEAQHTKFLANQRKIERFEQLSSLIDKTMSSDYPNAKDIKDKLLNKKQILEVQVKANTDAIKFNNDVDILNAKIDLVVTQKREFLARQELLNSDIMNAQSRLNRFTILRKAFSPTGLVAFKLENIIKEFENEINNYLIEFSDGQFQLNFRLEGEKLNIIVFNNGVESPIENVSEGEFSRIQTSTLLAIRKLLSKLGGIKINFLFLDEVMGVLDQAGKNKLIEILQEEEETNTFIVAHEYNNPLVPKLTIIKENNIARIT
jgi:energy-coupling factor transporter ATP-binding protein EcfA2